MFDTPTPRLFGVPPGVDFPQAVVDGLRAGLDGHPPEAMANVTLILNTARMIRRVRAMFDAGPPGFHPRIMLLSQVETLLTGPRPAPPAGPLERQFQLMQLVAGLAERQRYLAPQSSIFALTQSLAALMDEMQGEGVGLADLEALDISDASQHWQSALAFVRIAHDYATGTADQPDPLGRQRQIVQALIEQWNANPPQHPVILAGSTGSRGTTALLMQAVARLPQGAVILPGVDPHMPTDVWASLNNPLTGEDHPQYRFARLQRDAGLDPGPLPEWGRTPPASQQRNCIVSLALRPAPVTDAWLREGPELGALDMENVTLLQAPSPRAEANAIALRLRQAAQDGVTAALITPDRMLTRQVTSALDRWGITPDDSAGEPLHLSPAGRFLRHVAGLFLAPLDAEALLTLLKHPLCNSGPNKGNHGLYVQLLEAQLRRDRVPYPDADRLLSLVEKAASGLDEPEDLRAWGAWVAQNFCGHHHPDPAPLTDWVTTHRALAEQITGEDGRLWTDAAGRVAVEAFDTLQTAAPHGGIMSARDYSDVLRNVLSTAEVRDPDKPHPGILIWGTLEARVQGADLMILAGLNEGSWPETPAPDPWLNRAMRAEAGLLLPERRIGLSAHDFQQAIAAKEVMLTRSVRSEDAETVPSRWINRLTNLLNGLPDQGGKTAVQSMITRGDDWLAKAAALEVAPQIDPAPRPSPQPPVGARPKQLSVTEIQTLIRDPYAIYARHVLGLTPLDPLVQEPDAAIRGTLVHEIMEQFIRSETLTAEHLLAIADDLMDTHVPWPTIRAMWRARLLRISGPFVAAEQERQTRARPHLLEADAKGLLTLPEIDMRLTARADRIDLTPEGRAWLYDYKTGHVPSEKEQRAFDKQLLLQALMIERGGYGNLSAAPVAGASFIGIGASYKEQPAPLEHEPELYQRMLDLLGAYTLPNKGYTSRARIQRDGDAGRYDHLARYGEWDQTDDALPEDLQ